jgi:single-stranded-DNA-specific exonuclease
MHLGIECLITDDPARAHELAAALHAINAARRDLQDRGPRRCARRARHRRCRGAR